MIFRGVAGRVAVFLLATGLAVSACWGQSEPAAEGAGAVQDSAKAAPPADASSPAEVAAPVDEGAPIDPSRWVLDPEGRHSQWLSLPPLDGNDLRARPAAYGEVLASHGLLLDLDSPMLAMRGASLHDRNTLGHPVEYLVVTEKGRTYEATVIVRAMPSVVDACLRAMGLAPGSPTTFAEKDPLPSEVELEAGVSPWTMSAAGGPVLSISVQWTDSDGAPHDVPLEHLLLELPADGSEPRPLDELGWIYCGSTPGQYRQGRELVTWHRGDVEGDVVAIYLDGRGACLLERNSLDGLDGGLYTLNPDRAPPANTPVTLVLRPTGQHVTAHAINLDRTPDALSGDPSGR